MATGSKHVQKGVGGAKIMGEFPVSPDGEHASLIMNFRLDERGNLDSTQRKMHLIPQIWSAANPTPWASDGVLGMGYVTMDGGARPEVMFVTKTGLFRYAPWTRASGAAGFRGLEEVKEYRFNGPLTSSNSVIPQTDPLFPPQFEALGNRLYMTFGDGGGAWVWDGERVRRFGYTEKPAPPDVVGPARKQDSKTSVNGGGFSAAGRIGTLDPLWTRAVEKSFDGSGNPTTKGVGTDQYLFHEQVGGIHQGRYQYYGCWENVDGAYSALSAPGGVFTLRRRGADPDEAEADGGLVMEKLRRRAWVRNGQQGPPGTVAFILCRTANLEFLPEGDTGAPRFLHRIPGNVAVEYIDDIPDGELGGTWLDRETIPHGFYFLRHFGGSMFIMRTDANPSRVWWSEQTGPFGPTPESVLRGHWRDVYPETGPITGSIHTRPATGDGGSMMLVFKQEAVHYIAPEYPHWKFGTLHSGAGLAGPNLVQNCPDGTVVWYGASTFWQFDPRNGAVVDIGKTMRDTLKRVNVNRVSFGTSWIDRRAGEVRFALPMEDSDTNDLHFIWDYRVGGFRLANDVKVHAALAIPATETVLLAGDVATPPGVILVPGTNPSVWIYGKGYPGENFRQMEAVYRSGWIPMGGLHDYFTAEHLVVLGEERHYNDAAIRTYGDWNLDVAHLADSKTGADEILKSHHPENDDIRFLGGATSAAEAAGKAATFGVTKWRKRRPYSHMVAMGAESIEVLSVEVASLYPMALYNINAYGPILTDAVGRSPAL